MASSATVVIPSSTRELVSDCTVSAPGDAEISAGCMGVSDDNLAGSNAGEGEECSSDGRGEGGRACDDCGGVGSEDFSTGCSSGTADKDGEPVCIAGPVDCSRRLACSKALANACTLLKRWDGSLAIAVRTTSSIAGETVGIFSRSAGGAANICCAHTSLKDPWKGRSPLSHS